MYNSERFAALQEKRTTAETIIERIMAVVDRKGEANGQQVDAMRSLVNYRNKAELGLAKLQFKAPAMTAALDVAKAKLALQAKVES